MSLLAKSFFVLSCAGAAGIVWYVHWNQVSERQSIRQGIVKEFEGQDRKLENLQRLQAQIEITKQVISANEMGTEK